MKVFIALLIFISSLSFAFGQVQRGAFGMVVHYRQSDWPSLADQQIGSLRLWDSSTGWKDLNPKEGAYDWSHLDAYLSLGDQLNVQDVLFTFGHVPEWISSNPNDPACVGQNGVLNHGDCDPPKDLYTNQGHALLLSCS